MKPVSRNSRRARRPLATASLVVVVALAGREVGWAAPAPSSALPAASAQAGPPASPADDPARGLHYGDLRRSSAADPCRGRFEMRLANGESACTHGPDPAPEGVDVRQPASVPSGAGEATTAAATLACQGDGVSGARVQLVYARASGTTDRYAGMLPSFRQWAAQIDDVFNLSAAETGGSRHVRYVHDAQCVPTVLNVTLTASGDDNLTNTISELRAQGHSRSDRKYLVWMDANVYCGIAQVYTDDRPTQDNPNNGRTDIKGMVARVDSGCWGSSNGLVEVHELAHTLGSVQPNAPNATANGHCTDEYDRMCYSDAAGVTMRVVCSSTSHDNRLDCNHDDYFSTAPPAGSWLATHWNTANSVFLTATGGTSPPSTTTTTVAPPTTTTSTTRPPTTTTSTTKPPTTTTTVAPTTTTTRPPTTTTTVPRGARWVDQSFRDLLGRPPSAGDTSVVVGMLAAGTQRTDIAGLLVTSTEYRRTAVNGLFSRYLGRSASSLELDAFSNAIATGWLIDWVEAVVLGGDEFKATRAPTNAAYVDMLYSQVAGMTPTTSDRNFWITSLTNGVYDRLTVALAFVGSTPAHQKIVRDACTFFLDRAADSFTLSFWGSQLDGGMRRETVYAYFVGSDEYWSKV